MGKVKHSFSSILSDIVAFYAHSFLHLVAAQMVLHLRQLCYTLLDLSLSLLLLYCFLILWSVNRVVSLLV